MMRIAVVGGGLSGKLVALNVLRRAPPTSDVRVQVIDPGGEDHMGPAYSAESDVLLLNVPAEIMGASSEDADEFLRWAREIRGRAVEPGDFLPRRLFRSYLLGLLREAVRARTGEVAYRHVPARVTDVAVEGDAATLRLDDGRRLAADRVVLALGNFPPRAPPVSDPAVLASPRYAPDPWDPDLLDGLSSGDRVVFVGTGQTMVDLVLALRERGHEGPLTGISRRGLLPLTHPPDGSESYPGFFDELEGITDLRAVLRTIRGHVARAEARGILPQAVIDSLRTETQTLWSGFPEAEKRRFMRHVFRYWERIRSRIPPESGTTIDELRASGRLRIVAGRVRDLVDTGAGIQVRYQPRRDTGERTETGARVVNCIGPESDYRRVRDPLVVNLLARGLLRPGPAHIGMATTPGGAILDRHGRASAVLFTLGSTMKGLLWEVLAVPDIRVQAENLAPRLLGLAERPPAEA